MDLYNLAFVGLSAGISYVVEKAGDLLVGEAALLRSTRRDLEWMQEELLLMQAFLDHVASIHIQDARINIWTADLRRVASDAKQVLDSFSPQPHGGGADQGIKSRHEFGTEIQRLKERVAELTRRKATYGISIPDASSVGSTREELEWLQRQLRMMQAVLNQVATMKIQDDRFVVWIEETRKLAFDAEDIIDTFSLRAGDHLTANSTISGELPSLWSHDLAKEIARVKERVAELARMKDTYGIDIPIDGRRTDELLQVRRLTAAPCTEDEDMVGLDRHIMAMTDLLEREGSRRSVVAIVGMGGLGKTTLAKKLYNNLLSSSRGFACTAWVTVSQKYNLLDLLRSIARQVLMLSPRDEQEMNQDAISASICELLRTKKYLVVLDDVWSPQVWDALRAVLPDQGNRSRVIVTSRKVEVARLANPNLPPYELPVLDKEQSRILFTKRAFPNELENGHEQCCTGELASLREKIVNKCGGLPLAIIVASGLLSVREKSPTEWRKVAEKIEWQQTEKGEQCMAILGLSYTDLPAHLRPCFLYLAAIPEDCEVHVEQLMLLWIAEGFIEDREGKGLEETADTYFEELVQRCLIQVDGKWKFVGGRMCRVHDMVLELAISEAKKMWFLDVQRSGPASNRGEATMRRRRLSITHDNAEIDLPMESNKLRTLLISDRSDWECWCLDPSEAERNLRWHSTSVHKNLELLRVLQLGRGIGCPPEGIAGMTNLRYLKLSSGVITELPASLGNLRHLQALDVHRTCVEVFPESIWQIKTLRYVLGGTRGTRFPMPEASSTPRDIFKSLRVLHAILADPWMETILPNSIHLRVLDVRDSGKPFMPEHLRNTINKLQWLQRLRLSNTDYDIINIDGIFESHTQLQVLRVSNSTRYASLHLSRLPQYLSYVELWRFKINHDILGVLGKLKYLQQLMLDRISFIEEEEKEEKMVFSSGWFPQLNLLNLRSLDIKRWEVEEGSLPLLGELIIGNCPNLEELPEGLQHTTILKTLSVMSGHEQLHERLRRPRDGRPGGDDWYKVKHVPRIYLNRRAVT